MRVRVTIDTGSRGEAEVLAALISQEAKPESCRGYGFIRLGPRTRDETAAVLAAVADVVARGAVPWARVRWDDDERLFRAPRPVTA
jgi:hypothetical protein